MIVLLLISFVHGHLLDDGYEALFFGETMQLLASAACNESLPGCSDCAYQSFCGADPVRNYEIIAADDSEKHFPFRFNSIM
jgi:hypothetical protein